MHFNTRDLIGQKFFKLTVIKDSGKRRDRHILWLCKCDCGKETLRPGKELKNRGRVSCGCFLDTFIGNRTRIHGKAGSNIYTTWSKMLDRCNNPKNKSYRNYGGRGIKVCKRWLKFENFYKDMGDKPTQKHSIDRVNNNGNYSLKNCRWATSLEQGSNKRSNRRITFNGQGLTLTEWAKKIGLTAGTLHSRLKKLTIEKSLTNPSRYKK